MGSRETIATEAMALPILGSSPGILKTPLQPRLKRPSMTPTSGSCPNLNPAITVTPESYSAGNDLDSGVGSVFETGEYFAQYTRRKGRNGTIRALLEEGTAISSIFKIYVLCLLTIATACVPPPKMIKIGKNGGVADGAGPGTQDPARPDPSSPTNPEDDLNEKKTLVDKVMSNAMECADSSVVGEPSLRLLVRDEYQNTVRDVLKVKTDYRSSLPVEIEVHGFKNNTDIAAVSDSHLNAYLQTAVAIADEVVPNLKTLVGCEATEKATCATKMVALLGPALWRRPLTTEESKSLSSFYARVSTAPADEAMRALLSRLLLSPNFLYRSEIGKSGTLSPYETASALSYFFWGTVPDQILLDLAKNGTLTEETVLVAQANRLFDDPKANFLMDTFGQGWLGYQKLEGVTKDKKAFPSYSTDVQNLMIAEARDTFQHLVRRPGSKFSDLFQNDYSIGPPKLAEFYQAESSSEDGLQKIHDSESTRRGILGFGAILGTLASNFETHPIKRGHFVLENLLCHVPDPTPEGAVFKIPDVNPEMSTRERFAAHSNNAACKGCHIRIDNIGFGLEDFDGVGIFRATDNGKPIDASGTMIGIDGKDTKFEGTGDLSNKLAGSRQARRCMVLQLYRYAHGHMEKEKDICGVRALAESFEGKKLTLRDLIIEMTTHRGFQKRSAK